MRRNAATTIRVIMTILSVAAFLIGGSVAVQADPISWNGNYYESVKSGDGQLGTGISWYDAQTQARSRYFMGFRGSLVSITSQEENDFLYQNFATNVAYTWIGLHFEHNAFQWESGELFDFANWDDGFPGDSSSNGYVVMRGFNHQGKWANILWHGSLSVDHFLVEYSTATPAIPTLSARASIALFLGTLIAATLVLLRRRRLGSA